MKRTLFSLALATALAYICPAQVKWGSSSAPFSEVTWSNYSASYADRHNDATPFLVVCVPYNGVYTNFADINPGFNLDFSGSLYRSRPDLYRNTRWIYTYDSSEVYFLAHGIRQDNNDQYEYRVVLNATQVVRPWEKTEQFTEPGYALFKTSEPFGYLGGYKTSWGNYFIVELRRKGSDSIISAAVVYWKETSPVLLSIYTANQLDEFLTRIKSAPDLSITPEEIKRWKQQYAAAEIDTATSLPRKLVLPSREDNILFFVKAGIYKKRALEYRLLKDGAVHTAWKRNDFDNNFIWLKDLAPGSYTLQIRYRRQRQNVLTYPFVVTPAWQQTLAFKLVAAILILAFGGSIVLFVKLVRQRRKTAAEQYKKEKLRLELRAIHSQLNPHFIFNALGSIQGLVNKNDIAGANRYLSEFGSLMRDCLTGSNKESITLDREIVLLETYLSLEQMRFRFQYSLYADEAINASATEIPSLLLQPLVENAARHGVAGMQENGRISVCFKKEGNDIAARISDNGRGFSAGTDTRGHGLKLTKERIKLLNEVLKGQSIALTIGSTEGMGTTITVWFKNWLL